MYRVSVCVASGVAIFILLHDSSTDALSQNSPVNFQFWSNLFGGFSDLRNVDKNGSVQTEHGISRI